MTAFLTNHSSGYSLTCGQFLTSAFFPPLSASIFAGRHNDCADALNAEGESACCHRFVAFLEYIPVVGMIAGIVERIIAFVYTLLCAKTEEVEQPPADLNNRTVQIVADTLSIRPLPNTILQSPLIDSTPDLTNHVLPSPTDPRSRKLHEEVDSGNATAGSPAASRDSSATTPDTTETLVNIGNDLQEPSLLETTSIPPSSTASDQENNNPLNRESRAEQSLQASSSQQADQTISPIAPSRPSVGQEELVQETHLPSNHLEGNNLGGRGALKPSLSSGGLSNSTPPEKRAKQVQISEENNTVRTFAAPSSKPSAEEPKPPTQKKTRVLSKLDRIRNINHAKQRISKQHAVPTSEVTGTSNSN